MYSDAKSLTNPAVVTTGYKLDGLDQFIYGAEGNLTAKNVAPTYSDSFRTVWTSLSESATAPASTWTNHIRALWLANLFDQ